jgi:putative drug exporter of the RND superfamily
MIARLLDLSLRHRRGVIALWLVVLVAGFALAPVLFGRLTSEAGSIDNSESERAALAVFQAAPHGDSIFAVADGRAYTDRGLRASVESVAARVAARSGVASVTTPWTGVAADGVASAQGVSRDGRAVGILVQLRPGVDDGPALAAVVADLRTVDAPRVLVGGDPLLDDEMDAQAGHDLARAETLSMPVVLVLLLVIFGGIVAAGLPVVVAIFGVAATLGALALASLVSDISVYSVNIVTMLGLGLAVDYALLLVSRFREERAVDPDVQLALRGTLSTAGRTVAFSGLTVAASLAGLLVFPDDFLRSMGLASLTVVLLDMVAALTLLPALLSVVGHRIKPARATSADRGLFVWLTRVVRRRRVVVITLVAAALAAVAVPFFGVHFADPDSRSLPASSESRRVDEMLHERFANPGDVDPVTVVLRGSVSRDDLAPYVASLRRLGGVSTVSTRDGVPGLTVIDVAHRGSDQGPTATRLVREVRALDPPSPVEVGGDAAELVDYESALLSRLPWAVGLMVLATFVLLFLFTGSVVVPVKAILMNLFSLGAGFGALVFVFQEGHLGGLVGTQALGSLSVTTPVLVFAIAFGLSMDYEVFLLGRITEEWRRTGDTDRAVAYGLQRTGRTVTTAALLMSVVFAGFVAGGFSPVKQVGLGLVLVILVDATLVRMLLMPSVMSLMGKANWWSPAPLRRLHRRIGLSEAPRDAQAGANRGYSDTSDSRMPAGRADLAERAGPAGGAGQPVGATVGIDGAA